MKKTILFIALTAMSTLGYAQSTTPQSSSNNVWIFRGGVVIDSLLRLPVRGKTIIYPVISDLGAVLMNKSDSSLYYYDGLNFNEMVDDENFTGYFNSEFSLKTTDDLTEGASNFYFTNSRFNTSFSGKTTSDLAEGTNLYFTNARARSAISLMTTGTSGAATYSSATGVLNVPNYTFTPPGTNNASQYAAGTVYSMTTTSQLVDFGTTDPTVTIPAAGTYVIFTNVRLGYNNVTNLVTTKTINLKLRRTNNTAADVTNTSTNFIVPVIATGLLSTAGDCDVPVVVYTTANSNDVIELWGSISALTTTGQVQVQEASITAVRIF